MAQDDRFGLDWNDEELDFIVADYFSILHSELSGADYSKSAHRRSLIDRIGRTQGSVERKHQNISAVLSELALPTIAGYKPLPNFQKSIIDAIDRHLTSNPRSLNPEQSVSGLNEQQGLFGRNGRFDRQPGHR